MTTGCNPHQALKTRHIPPELISMIVHQARTGDATPTWKKDVASLSLVSSTFTDACQAELFRSLELSPPCVDVERRALTKNTQVLFSGLLEKSPHLAAYVQDLVVFLSKRPLKHGESEMVAVALKQLKNIKHLSIRGRPYCLRQFGFKRGSGPSPLEIALTTLVEQPTLCCLTLGDLSLPVEVFAHAKCQSAVAENCYFTDDAVSCYPKIEHPTSFKTLKLDANSAESLGNNCFQSITRNPGAADLEIRSMLAKMQGHEYDLDLKEAEWKEGLVQLFRTPWFNYSGLELLSLPIALPEEDERRTQDYILHQPVGLKELHLTTMKPYFDAGIDDWVCPDTGREGFYKHWESPLASLNTQSYATLASLSFKITFDFHYRHSIIRDPYHGIFCDGIFRNLHALEHVSFEIWVGGYRWEEMDNQASFAGDQWGELDRQLAPSVAQSAFPNLKSVGVLVGILEVVKCHEQCRDAIWRLVEDQVFNHQYSGLKKMEELGFLHLKLSTAETRGIEEDESEDESGR